MSRINYPVDYSGQRTLFSNMYAKHMLDAGASVLIPLFAQKGIDIADDNTDAEDADTHDANSASQSRLAESLRAQRDNAFDPVFKHLKGSVQFLKSFYKPVYTTLLDWGIDADTNGKIDYPPDFASQVTVFNNFNTKYLTYAAGTAPVEPYLTQQDIVMADDATTVGDAQTFQSDFQLASMTQEEETEARNNLWDPVEKHVHEVGDFLMKLYHDEPHTLGKWGFNIDSSDKKPKERISKILPLTHKTLSGIVLGSTLLNKSAIAVEISIGHGVSVSPVSIPAGGSFGMTKGHSVITISNPSSTITAEVEVLIHQ